MVKTHRKRKSGGATRRKIGSSSIKKFQKENYFYLDLNMIFLDLLVDILIEIDIQEMLIYWKM